MVADRSEFWRRIEDLENVFACARQMKPTGPNSIRSDSVLLEVDPSSARMLCEENPFEVAAVT